MSCTRRGQKMDGFDGYPWVPHKWGTVEKPCVGTFCNEMKLILKVHEVEKAHGTESTLRGF